MHYNRDMVTIPQRELRNRVSDVLRRAEQGELFLITVDGRPIAELGPHRTQRWVGRDRLRALIAEEPTPTLLDDLKLLQNDLADPFTVSGSVQRRPDQ
jgi:prevent-host-death family protein